MTERAWAAAVPAGGYNAAMEFIGEAVDVTCQGEPLRPVGFTWRGRRYTIDRVLASWHDSGFAESAPRKRTWRLRRHRNYYHVRTDTGEHFELYLDRAGNRREWILSKRLLVPPPVLPKAGRRPRARQS